MVEHCEPVGALPCVRGVEVLRVEEQVDCVEGTFLNEGGDEIEEEFPVDEAILIKPEFVVRVNAALS